MSEIPLPERASLEFLKKLAKDRLAGLRASNPSAQLADAQRAVARDHGFASWRALKAEIDRRRAPAIAAFMAACKAGDAAAVRAAVTADSRLVRERDANGSTGLHLGAVHPDVVGVLLEAGADPDARDIGDNITPLHLAAANRVLDSVRRLLDAGADVHGEGDLHKGGVIGWASAPGNDAVIDLLLARGARHHIFSAIALGDRDLVERIVDADPHQLSRRRSRFENGQTPLHMTVAPPDGQGGAPNYDMLQLLLDLGADLEAEDDRGRTPMAIAMLRNDSQAMRRLAAAGARTPAAPAPSRASDDELAASMSGLSPMLRVADIEASLRWYRALGFAELARHADDGIVNWALIGFGRIRFMLSSGGRAGPRSTSLWLYTDAIEPLYQRLKTRQIEAAQASLDGTAPTAPIEFIQDLYRPFYGGREFGIRDPDGHDLYFMQPD